MVLTAWLALAGLAAPAVDLNSLLGEMTDLDRLARRPSPGYTAAQASSFDRRAYQGDPFANGDSGWFIRDEVNEGRQERVLADLQGPGAVVRFWSANPAGIVRFYFDGEKTPRLEAGLADLLSGRHPKFPAPFAYVAARGTNLYFPFPFAKSLKITVQDPGGLYYTINHRTYAPGTAVRTFEMGQIADSALDLRRTARAVNSRPYGGSPMSGPKIAPGKSAVMVLRPGKPSAIREFKVRIPFPLVQTFAKLAWNDPHSEEAVLRNLLLEIEFDGQRTVSTPLGDFFGNPVGSAPFSTFPIELRKDGTMVCRFVMPFQGEARIRLVNTGKVEVPVHWSARTEPFAWDDRTYLFHAQWKADRVSTRPFRDLNFLDVRGEGAFVGTNIHIANSVQIWWGEGDEKAYVDGEERPSTFGTGTEDYFGYAWSSSELFQRPFHAQPRVDGPGNFGHTTNQRWHIVDAIPFTKSFRFDMELWHHFETTVTFARTAYWYAKPGGTPPVAIDRKLLPAPHLVPPPPVKGAIEGEKMELVSLTGGDLRVQGEYWELSGLYQRWWVHPAVGDRLVLGFEVAKAGRYRVVAHFGYARDYGIHRIKLAGRDLGPHDFFNDGLAWRRLDLGVFDLRRGREQIEFECVGANPKAEPSRMLGLDYLLLEPAD